MCEELPGGRDCVPSCCARICSTMPISAKLGMTQHATVVIVGLTILRISADISLCRNREKSKWRNRRRRAGSADRYWRLRLDDRREGWPSSHCGSRNVKMVDGKPSQPQDSVFAASWFDCVCSMLSLASDRRMPGGQVPHHTEISTQPNK